MKTLGKAILIFLLLCIGFAVVMAIHDGDKSSSGAATNRNSEQPDAPEERVQTVSALKLFIDYQRNEVAADNVYKGHRLAVQGMVTSISKDVFDKVYVSLATPNEFMNVQAHLDEGSEAQAANLQRGESITVICTGGGMIIGSPMLQNCSFARPQVETLSNTTQNEPATQPNEVIADNSEPSTSQQSNAEGDAPVKVGSAISSPVLLSSPKPEFPEAARQAHIGAEVVVHLLVDSDGQPSNVQGVSAVYIDREGHASGGPNSIGSGFGFTENAVNAVKKYRFKPAMENGKPVPAELNINLTFDTP